MNPGRRECPICRLETVPQWRAMCPGCTRSLPKQLVFDFNMAYRRRVINYAKYQEVLAVVYQYRKS